MNCKKRQYSCSLQTRDTAPGPTGNQVQVQQRQRSILPWSPTEPHFANALLQQDLLDRLPRSARPYAHRLLQHFASNTVTSISHGIESQQAWRTAIPDLTLKHDFVIHGVLAITALHISTTVDSIEAREDYQRLAALEFNVGLRQYMSQVRNITSDNVEALFAFSSTLSVFSTFQARNACRSLMESTTRASTPAQINVSEAVQIILNAMKTMRGAQVILVPGWSKIQDGPLRHVVSRESWSTPAPVSSAHSRDYRRLKMLESMWSNPRRAYEDHFEILRHTWQSLCTTFQIVWSLQDNASPSDASCGPSFDWTSLFHFAFQCSLEFANLVEQLSIEAWVLIAHYGCLSAEVQGLWWFDYSAVNLVTTAALVVGTQNWEWIAWPAASVGIDLESLRLSALDRPKVCP